jgi:(1->4)-alpha-D-glucan 1-alpha-D-glucosylmutase
VPDIYRGDELWFRALVDPDNRRPVDWAKRASALDAIQEALVPNAQIDPNRLRRWCALAEDDGLKLYVTARLLHLRRDHAAMMARGTYEPLQFSGPHAGRAFGFRRTLGTEELVVIVPRLTEGLGDKTPIGDVWGSTAILLPEQAGDREWRCELGGQVVPSRNGSLMLAEAMAILPMAVLVAR